MSTLYNIDFTLAAERLSPPSKRRPFYIKWLKTLLSPLQWLNTTFTKEYLSGSTALVYSSSTSYPYGSKVRYNEKIYWSVSSTPLLGATPGVSPYWQVALDSYIGIRQRINFNSQTMVLRHILNEKFGKSTSPKILIDNTDNDVDYNIIYNNEEGYAPIFLFQPGANSPVYIYKHSEYFPPIDFKVLVPQSILTNPSDVEERKKTAQLIDAEVMKYRIAGVNQKVIYTTDTYVEIVEVL